MYFKIGEIIFHSKTCRREVTEHRRKVAVRVYLMYKDSKDFDDGVRINQIKKEHKEKLGGLARKVWASKILEGEAVTASRVADAIKASHMVKSSSAVEQTAADLILE